MKNYIFETYAGNTFDGVAHEAKIKAIELAPQLVQFDFNGITCIVSDETNLDLLWRDYANAHLMEWKEVGHVCLDTYPDDVQIELSSRKKLQELRQQEMHVAYQKEIADKKKAAADKLSGVEFEISNQENYDKWVESNKDGYGAAIISYAETWGKLMQVEIANGSALADIAESTSREADIEGITGFMYGAAVQVLTTCWKHGEEIRKWHNKQYNHEGDGVVNPAILTIG